MREPKTGDIIWYRNNGGELLRVKVTGIDMKGKNGRPVFDGTVLNVDVGGRLAWGYFSQITRIE